MNSDPGATSGVITRVAAVHCSMFDLCHLSSTSIYWKLNRDPDILSSPLLGHNVPLELITYILSYLSPKDVDERKTLIEFGLVSHTWLSLTRRAAFSDLELTATKLKALLSPEYSDLFENPLATIPPLVVSLNIIDLKSEYLRPEAIPLVSNFKNVKTLEVETDMMQGFFDLDEIRHREFITAVPALFKNVTSLTICTLFLNFSELVVFICSFPFLEILDLDGGISYEKLHVQGGQPQHYNLSPSLKTMRIISPSLWRILPWLLSLPALPPIQNLLLKLWVALISSRDLNSLLQRLAPTLRRFFVDIGGSFPKPKDGTEPIFTFKHTKHLQFFRLSIWRFANVKCWFFPESREIRLQEIRLGDIYTSDSDSDSEMEDGRPLAGRSFLYVDPILATFPFHDGENGGGGADGWTMVVPRSCPKSQNWTKKNLPRLVKMGMKVDYT
ncbi:hypothetical protein CPB84DRAFT_1847944 [Gymnopilus junonius]|uniref:F-box domain-containing protein n=1 Tax=Gymnopilus junonius TaxID=109634 RepID=A0A9P5NN39_GYMJU|nr:hypothetical protein CPB84DRAFT_1847944 [Gymnopilus junonius]